MILPQHLPVKKVRNNKMVPSIPNEFKEQIINIYKIMLLNILNSNFLCI